MSQQCEAYLYSCCLWSPGESWRSSEEIMGEQEDHDILSCLLAK